MRVSLGVGTRVAMDMDYGHYMLTEAWKAKKNPPPQSLYQKLLAEVFNMNRSQILAFKNNHPPWSNLSPFFHHHLFIPLNLSSPGDTCLRDQRGHWMPLILWMIST